MDWLERPDESIRTIVHSLVAMLAVAVSFGAIAVVLVAVSIPLGAVR